MKKVELLILDRQNRKDLLFALADAGYKVTTKNMHELGATNSLVILEVEDGDVHNIGRCDDWDK